MAPVLFYVIIPLMISRHILTVRNGNFFAVSHYKNDEVSLI